MRKYRKDWSHKCVAMLVMLAMLISLTSVTPAKASGSYLIKVNKQANCVTIYQKDSQGEYEPIKAMVCSTGYATKTGTYSLGEKYRWHTLDGPCYGQYCTRIYGGVLFHSVWYREYNDPSSLSNYSYNKLGTTASHGCVRLTCGDAKWIYDNIPSGTTVQIYNSSNPGPLGKPKAIKLSGYTGYDPTDLWSPGNPWKNKKPSITVKSNVSSTVEYGSKFDAKQCITARNTTGFDATSMVKTIIIYGGQKVKKVDTKKPGTYKVTYKLTDEIGRKASVTVKFRVTAPKKTPKISGEDRLYINDKAKMTKGRILKNLVVKQGKEVLPAKYITVTFQKKENFYVAKVVAQNASEPARYKVRVYIDKKAPQFEGITHKEVRSVTRDQLVDQNYCLKDVSVSDNYSKLSAKDVEVTIMVNEDGTGYTVAYKVKDQAGNKTKIKVYYNFEDSLPVDPSQSTTTSAVTTAA